VVIKETQIMKDSVKKICRANKYAFHLSEVNLSIQTEKFTEGTLRITKPGEFYSLTGEVKTGWISTKQTELMMSKY